MRMFTWTMLALFSCSIVRAQQLGDNGGTKDAFRHTNTAAFVRWPDEPNFAQPMRIVSEKPWQNSKRTPEAAAAKPMKRTSIDGSMVGYIDDSTISSEIRMRFDAGWNDPRPDRAEYFYAGITGQAAPTDAIQYKLNFQEVYLQAEYAPMRRFSAFFQLPFRWIQPKFLKSGPPPDLPDEGGISDVQAGVKVGLFTTESRQLTFELVSVFPSGNGTIGLGTSHKSIAPTLLYSQRISARAAVEAEVGDSHPIGGTIFTSPAGLSQNFAGDVMMYGVGPSYQWIRRGNLSIAPVLELIAWHVFGGLQTGPLNIVQSADGINVFNMKLGARANFGNGNSIYAGYGRAITSDIWYRNLFRMEYRRTF